MMPDEYLKTVLSKYSTANGSALQATTIANELAPYIREWAGPHLASLDYSGSYAKNTAIAGEADLDLLISLISTLTKSLEEVYNSLFQFFAGKGFVPRKQNVSIGITYKGFRVDLVPAKRQGQRGNDLSLYTSRRRTWTKTNVQQHIGLVSGSARTQEIRLLKIWRNNRSLDFPSFYLELVVLHALHNQAVGQLANNVWKVFTYLSTDFVNARFVDPANSNNIISEDLGQAARQTIANHAAAALSAQDWNQIVV